LNWWLGLVSLLLVIAMGATGYLLRWDIKAFTLMDLLITNFQEVPFLGPALIQAMLGGAELDQIPLYRGFAFHVWVLPILLASTLVIHLLVAWRQGLADQPSRWQDLRARLPSTRFIELLPGIGLLVLVILLALGTPHEGSAGPVDRSLIPHPDWILGLYILPFWYFSQSARALGAAILPAVLLTFLIVLPRITNSRAKPWILSALALVATVGVILLFGQLSFMGYQVPSQGCAACHQPGILGGAPTTLSEFEIRDPDWLVFHLREPELSILTPSDPPEELP
jgi:quinol-cytochrome oxidoreductase complex cytochrome b subunit